MHDFKAEAGAGCRHCRKQPGPLLHPRKLSARAASNTQANCYVCVSLHVSSVCAARALKLLRARCTRRTRLHIGLLHMPHTCRPRPTRRTCASPHDSSVCAAALTSPAHTPVIARPLRSCPRLECLAAPQCAAIDAQQPVGPLCCSTLPQVVSVPTIVGVLFGATTSAR